MEATNGSKELAIGRQYFLEDVFESFSEYQRYLTKALALFQDQEKKRNPTFKKYVPEYLEVEFDNSIKAPRLYFPRYKGVIVVQLPANQLAPKKRAAVRERMLQRFVGVIKINELAVADEFAMRMRVIERSHRNVGRARS